MAQISVAPPIYTNAPLKKFSKGIFIESWILDIFETHLRTFGLVAKVLFELTFFACLLVGLTFSI
jgi:hypothetical protein